MKQSKPNIVLILIDDMGWRDLGCTGSTFYETPNIDRLCGQGMRFTEAYASCPVCSPSRASLLTGKYPARLGVTDWIDWGGFCHPCRGRLIDAPYVKELPEGEVTLAQALEEQGYRTWHVGKWHLGGEGRHPEQNGFDVNIGGCHWGNPQNGYFSPWGIPVLPEGPEGEYLTDRLTDEAIRLIQEGGEAPFFLNLWHYTVHTPIQAKEADIRRFADKARRLGLDKAEALIEGEHFPTEHKRDERVVRRIFQSDPAYAAMVWNLDWNVGRLVQALEEAGQAENTIIVFTSDNGGLSSAEGSPTCNLPAAEGKGWTYEGGLRVPLLVSLPGAIQGGTVCETPVTTPDLYPTLLEVAGLPPRPEQHVDGVSFAAALRGEDMPERPLFWHYPHYGNQGGTPGAAVRMGGYKLIEFYEDDRLELYHLESDPGEARNLAEQEPETARALRDLLRQWQSEVRARRPEKNPAW